MQWVAVVQHKRDYQQLYQENIIKINSQQTIEQSCSIQQLSIIVNMRVIQFIFVWTSKVVSQNTPKLQDLLIELKQQLDVRDWLNCVNLEVFLASLEKLEKSNIHYRKIDPNYRTGKSTKRIFKLVNSIKVTNTYPRCFRSGFYKFWLDYQTNPHYSLKNQNTTPMHPKELYKWRPIDINAEHDAPKERWGHRLIHVNHDSILMYGGFGGSTATAKYLDDLWLFNYTNNHWTLLQTLGSKPQPCSNYTLHYDPVQNQVIMFGGASQSKMRSNTIHILNLQTKIWRKIDLPETQARPWERTYHSSELIYPYLVVFGGESCANIDLNDLWAFNFIKNEWKQLSFTSQSKLPDPRRFQGSVFLNDYFYVIGGCSGSQYVKYGDIYRVNLSKLIKQQVYDGFEWQCVLKSNKYLERWGHSSEVFQGRIYITFGRVSPLLDSFDSFVFDPELKTVEKLEIDASYSPQSRRRHASTLIGSSLVVFGGYNGKYLSKLEYLSLQPARLADPLNIECVLKENFQQMQLQLRQFYTNKGKDLYRVISTSQIEIMEEFKKRNHIKNNYMLNLCQYSLDKTLKLPQFTELLHFQIVIMAITVHKVVLCPKAPIQFLQKLLQTVDYFCVPEVAQIIQGLLIDMVNDKNFQTLLSISSKYELQRLSFRCAEKYIRKHYKKLQSLQRLNEYWQKPSSFELQSDFSEGEIKQKSGIKSSNSFQQAFQLIKFDLFQTKLHQNKKNILSNLFRKIKNIFNCQDESEQSEADSHTENKLYRFGRFISKLCSKDNQRSSNPTV